MSEATNGWHWNDLTERQKQVALLAVEGKLNRYGIGREVGVSHSTVLFHLRAVYRKLSIRHGRVQLAFEMGRHWEEILRADKEGK